MRFVWFVHSLVSCWNHGNAHFLRGVARELIARGHEVLAYEPAEGWSRRNLRDDHGEAALARFHSDFPDLETATYGNSLDPADVCDTADAVLVHEWTDPAIVAAIGRVRARGGRFTLLFHDTHHRAVSDPAALRAFDLSGFDGVLTFGESLAEVYRHEGWGSRVFVWHEAADTRLFRPAARKPDRRGLVWIGNWGDGERSKELHEFLLEPARRTGLPLDVHGVRYPPEALNQLALFGARYHGWLANADVPAVFARHLATVHIPRRYYSAMLPGIPTIRVFEALACGIPLVSAPWEDSERLFRPGEDFLLARDGEEMSRHLATLAADPSLREALAATGLATIRARHTCAHRVDELLAILATFRQTVPA